MTGRVWISWLVVLLGAGMMPALAAAELPGDLQWETEGKLELIGSPKAVKGGTLRVTMSTFPLTLRHVGPDANTVLYMPILYNNWSMTTLHPNSRKPVSLLATHWALGKDGKSVYYKIDPKARWSDGKPVTAKDWVFALKFMRSKNINAPWYNTYYTDQIDKVVVYDDHTLSIHLPKKKPDLLMFADFSPLPTHFYGGNVTKSFVKKYNWKVEPNTGPYVIDNKKIRKGRSVTFVRKKDWWAKDRSFFQHRFNVDKILFKVVREKTVSWAHFKKGDLDFFDLSDPAYWHDKSKTEVFEKGWVDRMWFYNDRPRSCFGIWLNTKSDMFKDKKLREGVLHSMNMGKVIKVILRNEASRMESCTQGYGDYTDTSIAARRYDPGKAKKIFAAAGFKKRDADGYLVNEKGKRMGFSLLYAYDGHKDKLVVLVEEAKKVGLEMKLELKDWSAMVKQTNANKHEAGFSGFGARDSGIPQFWGIFHKVNAGKPNTNNHANLADDALSKMIDDYRSATDKNARVSLAHKIQRRIHENAVFVPTWVRPWFRTAYWRWWRHPEMPATRYSRSPFDMFDPSTGGLFWFDKKMRKETLAAKKSGKKLKPVIIKNETYRRKSAAKSTGTATPVTGKGA